MSISSLLLIAKNTLKNVSVKTGKAGVTALVNKINNGPAADVNMKDLGSEILKDLSRGVDQVTKLPLPNADEALKSVIRGIADTVINPPEPGKKPSDISLSNLLAGSGASKRKKQGKGLVPHGQGLVPHGQRGRGVAYI